MFSSLKNTLAQLERAHISFFLLALTHFQALILKDGCCLPLSPCFCFKESPQDSSILIIIPFFRNCSSVNSCCLNSLTNCIQHNIDSALTCQWVLTHSFLQISALVPLKIDNILPDIPIFFLIGATGLSYSIQVVQLYALGLLNGAL